MHYLGKKEKIGEWGEYDQSTYVIINLLFCTLKARIEIRVEKKKKTQEKFWLLLLHQGLQTNFVIAVENEPFKYTLPVPAHPVAI